MKNRAVLFFLLLTASCAVSAQSSSTYPCEELSVDTIFSSKLNPQQIQLNITNHDTSLTWGPTYFCITDIAGDTIAADTLCGCVLILRNKTGIFYVNPRNQAFRVPANYCCNLTLIGSGVTCTKQYKSCLLTGLPAEPAKEASMSLFPNPANSKFTLDLGSAPGQDTRMILLNMQGQIVYTETLYSRQTNLNPGVASAGLYIVQVYVRGLLVETKRLVIH
jgi:hypothetical protein